MSNPPRSKAPVHAVPLSSDPAASPPSPDATSEVVPRARRRPFSSADKRRILQAADLCTQPGEIGALMRREGVYSSSLSTWRRQREASDLGPPLPLKSAAPRPTPRASKPSLSPSSPARGASCAANSTRRSW
ncbi:hypothetical protein [Leptothrix ochracea]|uniref:hypothetical protein n=1 Tax=Leptothrix ochracea TaxID=735331 RepID=UPI0012EA5758|nr:hypothetical protein [Leptothrix ochracea]